MTFLLFIPLLLIVFFVSLPFVIIAYAFNILQQALPFILTFLLICSALGAFFLLLQPIFSKYAKQFDTASKIICLVLFGPLVLLIIGTVISLPFVLIYSLSANPIQSLLITFTVIFFVIAINVVNYRLNR